MVSSRKTLGFTIVELIVIIVVLAILATVTIVGYGAWRERVAKTEVVSDLQNAALSLKNERNFKGEYSLGLPSSYESSKEVTVTYKSGNKDFFCIEARSIVRPNVLFFVNSSSQVTPIAGTCSGGPGASPLTPGYSDVVAGGVHSCAILAANSSAYCWGGNAGGELGNNSTTNSSVPVAVTTSGALSGKTIKSISAGGSHTCVVASDDAAYCWGQNNNGQLGNNSTTNSSVPVAVTTSGALSGKTIKSISAGFYYTCVIASDNNAYCWGQNSSGQLGNNSTTNSSVPVAVTTSGALSGKTIKSISAGYTNTCVIASDNNAYCWGYNSNGALGNNSNTDSSVPVAVTTSGALSGKTIKSISAGLTHACAVASDNKVYCWGWNILGQLGNNSTTNSSVPVAVTTSGALSGKLITTTNAGAYISCVVATDTKTYCWGTNNSGQLGNNSTTNSSVPVAVTTSGALSGKTVINVSVSITSGHVCTLTSDGGAYCSGTNTSGQLGNGSVENSSVPVHSNDP